MIFIFCEPLSYLACFIIVACSYYWYLTRHYTYWSKLGIDGPKPLIFFGTTIYDFIGMKHIYERQWMQKYGKIYGMYNNWKPYLTVGDPKIIKDIFINDIDQFMEKGLSRPNQIITMHLQNSNESWKRLRPMMTPVFSPAKLRHMYPKIVTCVEHMAREMQVLANEGTEVNVKNLIGKFVNNVTCSSTMGIKVHPSKLDEFVVNCKRVFDFKVLYSLGLKLLPLSHMRRILAKFGSEANIGNEFFLDIGRQLMREWKGCDGKAFSLIQLLMNKYNKNNSESNDGKCVDINQNKVMSTQSVNKDVFITEEEILAEVWIFFVANYGMTANYLSSLIHTLTVRHDIQQRLYDELSATFGSDCGADIDCEKLMSLTYLNAVVSEGLRLYVPVLRLSRIAANDYRLGDTGITVKKGMQIEIPLYAIHTCAEYFPNPDSFIPERFMPGHEHEIIPGTYMPFGVGPRQCLAIRYATLQIKTFLAHLLMRYRFYATANTGQQMTMFKHTNFQGPRTVVVGVEPR